MPMDLSKQNMACALCISTYPAMARVNTGGSTQPPRPLKD
jgi:hypothetical protein